MATLTGIREFLHRRRRLIILAVLLLLLVNIAFMGASLAKYVEEHDGGEGASISGFAPTITCDESWEHKEQVSVSSAARPTELPFRVSNTDGDTSVIVIVTLTTEQILPLSFDLYVGDDLLRPDSTVGGTSVYQYVIDVEDKDFSLVVSWGADQYDERFNGLTNDITLTVVCEQYQLGDAS